MRVHYDNAVDAIYIKLGNQKPDGVVEISEGVNLGSAPAGRKKKKWTPIPTTKSTLL